MADRTAEQPVFVTDPDGSVRFRYRNYKGEVAVRHVRFVHDRGRGLFWGHSEHHTGNQWLLDAWDLDRDAMRTFALRDILAPVVDALPPAGVPGNGVVRGDTEDNGR